MFMMPGWLRIGSGFLLAFTATTQTVPEPAAPRLPKPLDLLNLAYAMNGSQPDRERAPTLFFLAQAVEPLSKAKAREWSIELFRLAGQITAQDADAMQKNALVALSWVDPLEADELFRQQKLPKREPGHEDTRVYAAMAVFPALYGAQGAKSLDEIESLAAWLGQTGQYPYAAVASIITGVEKIDLTRARALWFRAMSSYKGDLGFRGTENFVVDFLLKTQEVPDRGALTDTLKSVVGWLEERSKSEAGGKDPKILEARSGQHSVRFGSEGELQIFRLLPLIRKMDADWAAKILEDRPGLKDALDANPGANYTMGGVIVHNPAATAADVQRTLDENRLRQIEAVAQTDPGAAMQMASGLADPFVRNLATAAVLPAYAGAGIGEAKPILSDLAKAVDSLGPSADKLHLEISFAQAYYATGRASDADSLLARALSTGEEIYAENALAEPGKVTFAIKGFDELLDAANLLGAKSDKPWDALESIKQFQVDAIRPDLLVYFAKGLMARNSSRATPPAGRN
jgi:hypothetical protein